MPGISYFLPSNRWRWTSRCRHKSCRNISPFPKMYRSQGPALHFEAPKSCSPKSKADDGRDTKCLSSRRGMQCGCKTAGSRRKSSRLPISGGIGDKWRYIFARKNLVDCRESETFFEVLKATTVCGRVCLHCFKDWGNLAVHPLLVAMPALVVTMELPS